MKSAQNISNFLVKTGELTNASMHEQISRYSNLSQLKKVAPHI